MIVDVFMFLDDFPMLDCRLYELGGVVDRFIAIEGSHTFSGIPKPYYLTDNYKGYPVEVVHVDLSDVSDMPVRQEAWITPGSEINWMREEKQREAARPILDWLAPDDIVIYGDLDEIPRREVVQNFDGLPSALWMYYLMYSLCYRHPNAWAGTVMGTRKNLGPSPLAGRNLRNNLRPIRDAGWHLGWFGDPAERIQKMRAHTHKELANEIGDDIGESYPSQMRHVNSGIRLVEFNPEWGYPRWVRDGLAPEIWHKRWASE